MNTRYFLITYQHLIKIFVLSLFIITITITIFIVVLGGASSLYVNYPHYDHDDQDHGHQAQSIYISGLCILSAGKLPSLSLSQSQSRS